MATTRAERPAEQRTTTTVARTVYKADVCSVQENKERANKSEEERTCGSRAVVSAPALIPVPAPVGDDADRRTLRCLRLDALARGGEADRDTNGLVVDGGDGRLSRAPCAEKGIEARDLLAGRYEGRREAVVFVAEELDLGLELGEPRLLALAALEGGWNTRRLSEDGGFNGV